MKKLKIILIIILFIPLNVLAIELPELNSNKFIIYDRTTNKVLNELNSNEKTSIASLTKIMTVITAIEHINNLEDQVIVTSQMLNSVYWNASRAGLNVGDTLTYKDLLYATILPSGADATHVLAYAISGNVNSFVEEMNTLAKSLGLNNTHFSNVSGIDNINNYSTLADITKILDYALKNNTFKEVYTTREYQLTNGLRVKSTLNEYNKTMMIDTKRILGSKTGFTNNAGYCLASLINSNNHDIIIITGGAKKFEKKYYHIIDTLNLISYTDELILENVEKERIEQENLEFQKEQEEKAKLKELSLSKIKRNQIYVNRALVIGGVFLGCMFIVIICKPKKRRKRK